MESFRRQIPTVYGVQMRRMTTFGPSGTVEDEIKLLAGVGRSSAAYQMDYNKSSSGKKRSS